MPEDYQNNWEIKEVVENRMRLNAEMTQQSQSDTTSQYTADELAIIETCNVLIDFLLAKNKNYGNSALEPLRTFPKASSEEQLLIRMDDKLSRIKNANEPKMNDIVDLTGYLILYIVKKEWTSEIKEMID